MKSEDEINEVIRKLPLVGKTNYPGMTYESGIEIALLWVLGEISDDEFEY